MSLQFNDATTKKGIVQTIDKNCKSNRVSYPLLDIAADVNLALDKAFSIIFKAGGKWQFDDSNHTDYPIIMTHLVDGQRDYSFVTDEQGNMILDIYKVMVKNQDGIYQEVFPKDQQSDSGTEGFTDGTNTEGVPLYYDKTANGIFLEQIPSYNSTNGLKVFINREGSYFASTDTTKKAGFAGLFHEYLALRPSYFYAIRNGLKNKNDLKNEMIEMEDALKKYYRDRAKDESSHLEAEPINSV